MCASVLSKITAAALAVSFCSVSVKHVSAFSPAFNPVSFRNAPAATQSPLFTRTPTQLNALNIPAATWSAIGHVVGGASGAVIVAPATKSGGWYEKIDLPPWVPPNRLFAPVWTALYACMGVAAARVYKLSGGGLSSPPMIMWAAHYAINLAWAPAFFGKQMLRLGQAINFALISTLVPIIVMYYRLDPLSAYLLLPYLAWTTFATVLNGAICKRNPTSGGMNEAKFQSKMIQVQKGAADYADSW